MEQAGKIWRIAGIKSFKGEGGNFKLDASVDGEPVKFLQNGDTRISISFACNNTCEGIWLGDRKGVWPVNKLGVGLFVVMI